MGVLRPDNGGAPPPDDGTPHGVPDLPPEWGTIVIPDNAAELDREAAQVRRELRRGTRGGRLRKIFGVPANPNGLGVPLIIMSVAVITTLISLFVVTWDRRPATYTAAPPTVSTAGTPLPDLTFTNAAGATVTLRPTLPAVVLLVDGCDCATLIRDTAGLAPPGVTVVVVAATLPKIAEARPDTVALADPQGVLRGRYAAGSGQAGARAATALFVDRQGTVRTTVPDVTSIARLGTAMADLATAPTN
ncbi:hypothetical protein GCM10009682_48410 [Luedemannella flava]|uniref:Redoxin domain-containing protein n=1 Tax=Luedemannella flava TaxID=349316 RepID=A0ABN2MEW0_9ACTN